LQSQMNILILLSISTNLNPGQRRKSFVKITPIHGCQESIGIVKDSYFLTFRSAEVFSSLFMRNSLA